MVRALVLVLLVACQGGSSTSRSGSNGSASVPIGSEAGFGTPDDADVELQAIEDAPPKIEEPEPPDPGKLIAELGAIPAWQAVVDRAQLLARRGQRGVVYGRIGPPVMELGPAPEHTGPGKPPDAALVESPYVWLVDDTEGNGTLGIRVLLGDEQAKAKQGDRVALAGAWFLDDAKRWHWRVDSVTPVPPGPTSGLPDPPAPIPTHEIQQGGAPAGARMITFARDNDAIYFQIVGPPPVRAGDGWLVANELGDTPFARLTLPGERAAYGGQDMRADDERWALKRATTYWVRIGRIRKPATWKEKDPVYMTARTAPVKVN